MIDIWEQLFSGKSTLLSCMIYALGMEELLGGKSETVLSYALRDYVELQGAKATILASHVLLEISNATETVTLRRQIKSNEKSTKLIEVIKGSAITKPNNYEVQPTFVHDAGGATSHDFGFHRFLEAFLGLQLPRVPSTQGGLVKLYLQTVFAAIFVEQKRGWTDYLANIPYYRIRDSFERVVEFILNLDVFENSERRAALNERLAGLQNSWSQLAYEIQLKAEAARLSVIGLPHRITADFDVDLVSLRKSMEDGSVSVYQYIAEKERDLAEVDKQRSALAPTSSAQEEDIGALSDRIVALTLSSESLARDIAVNKATLSNHRTALEEIARDIDANKMADKIRRLGGELGLSVAKDICPTCHQPIDDSLLLADTLPHPMSIKENIGYLESQKKMLEAFAAGTKELISKQVNQLSTVSETVNSLRKQVLAIKRDYRENDPAAREFLLRRRMQLEDEIDLCTRAEDEISTLLSNTNNIMATWKETLREAGSLPKEHLSADDHEKLSALENEFRSTARAFGYRSADLSKIEINRDTYTPYLAGTELREINVKVDVKTDSSASDFVRLIWSYLITLYGVSFLKFGNHLGLLIFDEPAQHSMSAHSVNALFRKLDLQQNLQSIIAASFDESDELYREETLGVEPNLIRIEGKLFSR